MNNTSTPTIPKNGFISRKILIEIYISIFLTLLFGLTCSVAFAQDPALPPTNLSISNVYDGVAGKPGLVYVNYTQSFQTRHIMDASGDRINTTLKVNSISSLHQFIYLTPVRLLGGNLGFTVIVPLVKIASTSNDGNEPSVNPGLFGDIVQGTAIQWSDKKIGNKSLSHRLEFDISIPTGTYDKQYAINESAHLYTFSLYHAFTLFLNNKFSISSRNQINYNTHIIGQKDRPGAFYNGNYSIDYAITKQLRVEAIGYLLNQFTQDKYSGNDQYYQSTYGITNTKERVAGYGAGLGYALPSGALIEIKSAWESGGKNRAEGIRSTLRIAIPLTQ